MKSTGMAAAALALGFSTLFAAAAPATAAVLCADGGTLLAGGVCELAFTATGAATFTPNSSMSQLEVLLVGGGSAGSAYSVGGGEGGYGGSGGEVLLQGFPDTSAPLDLVVGAAGFGTSVTQDTTNTYAAPALSWESGSHKPMWQATDFAAGGGAGASPVNAYDGGAGVVASSLATVGSPFISDSNCYGGGGAVYNVGHVGIATCGGGSVTQGIPAGNAVAPQANSGGGGGGGLMLPQQNLKGAAGVVVVRWKITVPITATFNLGSHGVQIDPQGIVSGGSATRPADPTADGFTFGGWFTDSALTTAADFTAPISADTTFYASWSAVMPAATGSTLAATGLGVSPVDVPLGAAALVVGLGLMAVASRRLRASKAGVTR